MPRPRTRSDEELLAAAARVVGRVGPTRLTLADVAREAGLSAPTLIQRFGSKRGLLLAVSGAGADAVRTTFAAARADEPAPLDALLLALGRMASTLGGADEIANHVAFLALDLADAELRRPAVRHARTVRAEVHALLESAARSGELAADGLEELAAGVQVVYNGALVTWALEPRGDVEDWVRGQVARAIAPFRGRGRASDEGSQSLSGPIR